MTWFLVVVFLGVDGSTTIKDGWYPRQQPNQQVCKERVALVFEALATIAEVGTFTVECVRVGKGLKI